jgi:hypothetical protein
MWHPLARGQVEIQDGFWKHWRDLIGETTLAHQFEEMRADGHLDAMLLDKRLYRGRELSDPGGRILGSQRFLGFRSREMVGGGAARRRFLSVFQRLRSADPPLQARLCGRQSVFGGKLAFLLLPA